MPLLILTTSNRLAHSLLVLANSKGCEDGEDGDDPAKGLEYQGSLVET